MFAVGILGKKNDDERLLAREVVTFSDLLPARDDTWWHGLQAGVLGTDLARLRLRVLPGVNENGPHLRNYVVELRDGDRSYRRSFSLSSLASVARRAVLHLAELKTIEADDDYHFFLTTLSEDEGPAPPTDNPRATRRLEPPVFEPSRLADFMQRSQLLPGSPDTEEGASHAPLFVPADVWEQGHAQARRGGTRESAAVWTGRLFRDTESPALFMVLEACIEAEHAAEEPLAVTFSGETWARVRDVLALRRRRLNRPHERILGAVHGHNFGPEPDAEGRMACAGLRHGQGLRPHHRPAQRRRPVVASRRLCRATLGCLSRLGPQCPRRGLAHVWIVRGHAGAASRVSAIGSITAKVDS